MINSGRNQLLLRNISYYVLSVKDNQKALHEEIKDCFVYMKKNIYYLFLILITHVTQQ